MLRVAAVAAGVLTAAGLIALAPGSADPSAARPSVSMAADAVPSGAAARAAPASATPPAKSASGSAPRPAQPAAAPSATAGARPANDEVRLGVGADLGGRRPFPADNAWNQDISASPVDPASDRIIARIGPDTALHPDFGRQYGIPYVVVPGTQPKVPVKFEYADESDPGPYPVPPDPPIEGGPDSKGDRHILMIDRDNWKLYELYAAYPEDGGKRWRAGSGAIFDLASNKLRPTGWTSADAAGLPVFPGLVRYDEVVLRKSIDHAVRFTVKRTRRAFIAPATHFASSAGDADLPPMGMRVRLKAAFDTSGFPASARTILAALKKYGMILADNGSNWFVTGAPDPRWNDDELNTLKRVKGRDLEVVRMGDTVTPRR